MELHGGYRHRASEQTGKPVEEWLDFSANINPFGMPDGMKEADDGVRELEGALSRSRTSHRGLAQIRVHDT